MAQWYYGNASYFNSCPVGHDCCDGYLDVAYGNWFTDQSCGILPKRGCDDVIRIKDLCKNEPIYVAISTQCECAFNVGCSIRTKCNGVLEGYSTPILDLTDDLFFVLHGSLTDGRVRFGVYT
jgi:hypothetical protein